MRYTDKKPDENQYAYLRTTLQVFSLKVAGIREGLQWPIHVFGTVFLRDSLDHKRNTIFNRERDDCQILTQEVCHFFLLIHCLFCLTSYAALSTSHNSMHIYILVVALTIVSH